MLRAWDRISETYTNDEIVEGHVVNCVKIGLSATSALKHSYQVLK